MNSNPPPYQGLKVQLATERAGRYEFATRLLFPHSWIEVKHPCCLDPQLGSIGMQRVKD
jgi:hypothetical protein